MEEEDNYDSEEDEDYDPEAGNKRKGTKRKSQQDPGAKQTTEVEGGRGGQSVVPTDPLAELKEKTKKAKVDALWAQLNAPKQTIQGRTNSLPVVVNKAQSGVAKGVPEWMVSLGLAKSTPKREGADGEANANANGGEEKVEQKESNESEAREEARAVAAAAIAAARAAQAGVDLEGHPQVPEVRDFAGEKVVIARKVDLNAPAKQKGKPVSGLDALIRQIEKKKKINVLDKSRKDWGEYKEEQGVTVQLEEYKKSNDKYLDKVAFLQRAELREYEVERDQKLAAARKKPT